jgi:hypothetical protein
MSQYFTYIFLQNCNIDDLPCPSIFLERLCFEMDKNYLETKLQLLLSHAVLVAKDTFLVIKLMIYTCQRSYIKCLYSPVSLKLES